MERPMSTAPNGPVTVGNLTVFTNPVPVERAPMTAAASQSQREAGLRFILVNGNSAGDDAHCALCCEKIGESYVREMQTRLLYCDSRCYCGHIAFSHLAIEARARKAS
jgi:hypothetical protein